MTYVYRLIIAAPLAWLSAGILVKAIHWFMWNLMGVDRIPWGPRIDTGLLWLCGFIALATLVRELPHLHRIAIAAIASYFITPYLLEGLFWTFDSPPPAPGPVLAYLYVFFGLFSYAVVGSWLKRIPPLTFLL